MPQRTRVLILLIVSTALTAGFLVVVSVLAPERLRWYLREFGGLLTMGWAVWLAEGALRRLTAHPLRADAEGPPAPGERARLSLAIATALAVGAVVGAFILEPWWQAPALGGIALVALAVWHAAGRTGTRARSAPSD